MNIIKEYCPDNHTAVIRTDSYGSTLGKFLSLFQEAQNDFPDLYPDFVTIVRYGGQRYAKTFGIEFEVRGFVPEEYKRISTLEYTL